MVAKVGPTEYNVVLKFGGGLHTRASEDEIDGREAAGGNNFQLDLEDKQLRPRKPFDLIGTVPNEAEIRGGISLLSSDGSVYTAFQAGDTVYEWDGFDGFTDIGSVNANSRLRGHWRSHSWTLGDSVLITDLSLLEVVKEWNGGSTFANVAFLSDPSTSFGSFYAKYCSISNERAMFAHVRDGTGTYPHIIVGSAQSDYETISVDDRPSSALSDADPFFLVSPDLKPINGLVGSFGTTLISTEKGEMFNLTGTSAQDFAFDSFYPGSSAAGEESLAYVGNDIIYGRQGRMESVVDTDKFGDSEADDLTSGISDQVAGYSGWTTVYNSRVNRVYAFPTGESEVWVFQTAMRGGDVSPWMRWKTLHPMAFQPTMAMSMLDPDDGLEYVFMGDTDGNIYRLEGSGTDGDGSAYGIETEWLTKLLSVDLNAQAFEIEGYIKYRKNEELSVDLVFEYAGVNVFNETISVTLPAISGRPGYSGGLYYSNGAYYSSIQGRLTRQRFDVHGQGNEFQIRIKAQSPSDFTINEIGLRFLAAG